jgi:uncharacterized protein involved in exopolysaccharide biosynthesis
MDGKESTMSFLDLLALARRRWALLACVVAASMALAVAYALLATRQYRVESILAAPANATASGADQMLSRFGGLASLAGLPTTDNQARTQEAVTILRSRAFLREVVETRQLLPKLFEDDWNETAREWQPEHAHSIDDGAEALEGLFTVSLDRATGFVVLVLTWRDREQASEWSKLLVREVNERMRIAARDQATQSLKFLEDELTRTSAMEVREAVYGLMESQIKTRMLTNVTESYALNFLAPPVVPEADDFVWPKLAALLLLGLTGGFVLGLAVARYIDGRVSAAARDSGPLAPHATEA